jgi:hypothetical protein
MICHHCALPFVYGDEPMKVQRVRLVRNPSTSGTEFRPVALEDGKPFLLFHYHCMAEMGGLNMVGAEGGRIDG